jgi:AbiV family abortive infection protein
MKACTHTTEGLLDGAYYNLELGGILLHDAIVLSKQECYSSAVVLAVFSREAIGMSNCLLEFRNSARESGSPNVKLDRRKFEDHPKKLDCGITGTTIRVSAGSLPKRNWNVWEFAWFVRRQADIKRKRTPDDTHKLRKRALYADPTETGRWNRPSDIGKTECQSLLEDVAHDYAQRRNEWKRIPESKSYPQLPSPTWPTL